MKIGCSTWQLLLETQLPDVCIKVSIEKLNNNDAKKEKREKVESGELQEQAKEEKKFRL